MTSQERDLLVLSCCLKCKGKEKLENYNNFNTTGKCKTKYCRHRSLVLLVKAGFRVESVAIDRCVEV